MGESLPSAEGLAGSLRMEAENCLRREKKLSEVASIAESRENSGKVVEMIEGSGRLTRSLEELVEEASELAEAVARISQEAILSTKTDAANFLKNIKQILK